MSKGRDSVLFEPTIIPPIQHFRSVRQPMSREATMQLFHGAKMLTDPIADMLTRIRNANKAMHDSAQMPTSRMKEEIARLLKDEGYIKDFRVVEGTPFSTLVVELKFGRNRERVITDLKRISKPGRRVYARKDRLPRVLGGLGTAILSTSTGVITSRQAAERGVGGEVLAFVW
jgi:small subunit ribosomal protein S8